MKAAIKNYGIFTIALLALTIAFSTTTLANEDKGKKNTTSGTELKFIGNVDNQPVFELSLNSSEDDEYTVTFRDEAGNVIYTDKFKGTAITKKFLLKTEEFGDSVLNVVVKSKKTNQTEVYSINRSHSYVEETVVNKVK